MDTFYSGRIALFPLSSPLFPGATLALTLFEPRYIKLMHERAQEVPIFGVVLTESGSEVGDQPTTHRIGTAATLVTAVQHDEGHFSMVVQGTRRFEIIAHDWLAEYMMADVTWHTESTVSTPSVATKVEVVQRMFIDYVVKLADQLGDERAKQALPDAIVEALSPDPEIRSFQIAAQLPLNTWQQQSLLEIDSVERRLETIIEITRRERRLLDVAGPATAPETHPGTTFSAN